MHLAVQNLLSLVLHTVTSQPPPKLALSEAQIRDYTDDRIKQFLWWLAENNHLTDFQIFRADQLKTITVRHEAEPAPGYGSSDGTIHKTTISLEGTPLLDWEPFEFIYPCEICHAYAKAGTSVKPFKDCPLCRGSAKRTALDDELEHEAVRIEERLKFLTNLQATWRWTTEKPVVHSSTRPDHALVVAIEQLSAKVKAIQKELNFRKGICHSWEQTDTIQRMDELFAEFLESRRPRFQEETREEREERLFQNEMKRG